MEDTSTSAKQLPVISMIVILIFCSFVYVYPQFQLGS